MPGVSVVIPTFNRAHLVAEAIRSVLAQTLPPLEIIVVDDGSRDATSEGLAAFGPKIRVIRQEHRGVSATRNAGIAAARGTWLALLDSDDLWRPTKLEAQIRYLEQHPDLLLCQTEELWLRHGRRLNPKSYHRKPSGYCFQKLLERCLVSPSALLIQRRLLDRIGGFDETLPACEDYDLWLRLGCRFPIGLVEQPLVIKRGGHPDQLSSTIPALDRYRIRALVKILLSGDLTRLQQTQAMAVLEKKCHIYASGRDNRGHPESARQYRELPDKIRAHLATDPARPPLQP
ncbi:MAG: glycosyl transferase [Syntrophobacteraceae bacterium CG2_30_61_12]|nr:MAG: glycosyl transferase [Syntrophobacteraceae bacterium CG2_30_61_12]